MRYLLLFVLFLAGLGAFWLLGGEKLAEKVTEARVEQALLDNGLPQSVASCMAPPMVEELTLDQLRALEALAPEDGESALPRNIDDALARLRRVEDQEAIRVLATTGTSCAIEIMRERVEEEFERQRGLQ